MINNIKNKVAPYEHEGRWFKAFIEKDENGVLKLTRCDLPGAELTEDGLKLPEGFHAVEHNFDVHFTAPAVLAGPEHVTGGGGGGGDITERPVITLMGNEGTASGGIRTIPIDLSQVDFSNPPIINIVSIGSLIPTKADFMGTPIIQYSNFSRANGTDVGSRHTFVWTDVSASQSDDLPGIILDFESGFNVIIKTITHVYEEA